MKKVHAQNNVLLAGCIFVLWSVGIIFIPTIESNSTPLFLGAVILYLILHVLVFIFTLPFFKESVRGLRNKSRGSKAASVLSVCLYGYVLLSLFVSAYLLARTLHF